MFGALLRKNPFSLLDRDMPLRSRKMLLPPPPRTTTTTTITTTTAPRTERALEKPAVHPQPTEEVPQELAAPDKELQEDEPFADLMPRISSFHRSLFDRFITAASASASASGSSSPLKHKHSGSAPASSWKTSLSYTSSNDGRSVTRKTYEDSNGKRKFEVVETVDMGDRVVHKRIRSTEPIGAGADTTTSGEVAVESVEDQQEQEQQQRFPPPEGWNKDSDSRLVAPLTPEPGNASDAANGHDDAGNDVPSMVMSPAKTGTSRLVQVTYEGVESDSEFCELWNSRSSSSAKRGRRKRKAGGRRSGRRGEGK